MNAWTHNFLNILASACSLASVFLMSWFHLCCSIFSSLFSCWFVAGDYCDKLNETKWKEMQILSFVTLCSKVITSKTKSYFAEYFWGILTPIKIYLPRKRMPQNGEIDCFQQIQIRFPSMIRTVFGNRSIAHPRALAVAFKTTIGMERINFLKISWPNWSASSHSIAEEIFQSGGICLQTSLACTIGLWSALTLLNLGTWIC